MFACRKNTGSSSVENVVPSLFQEKTVESDFQKEKRQSTATRAEMITGSPIKILTVLEQMRNKHKIHLIGNAHIDPVWLWRWQEGLAEIKATFRSVLDRMDEFPDFIFTSACAAYYKWVEENGAPRTLTHDHKVVTRV
jgi:alpha-mannosidase